MTMDKKEFKKLTDEELEQVNGGLHIHRVGGNKNEEEGVVPPLGSWQDKKEDDKEVIYPG